jgi:hypothetical protein
MPVKVSRSDSGIGAVPPGTKITLEVSPVGVDDTVKWERSSKEMGTAASLPVTVDANTVGKYTATVTHKAGSSDTSDFDVSLAAESKPFYDPPFAKSAAQIIGIVSGVVLLIGAFRIFEKSGEDWTATGGNLMFAAALTLPVIVLGGLTLAIGLFMAAVEWRGRFKADEKAKTDSTVTTSIAIPDNLDKIIESIGKLQGATLVLLVGLLLLLGSVWGVASSAAGTAPSASPSPSPSASASGTTGASPTPSPSR